jgi:hypothetical protein
MVETLYIVESNMTLVYVRKYPELDIGEENIGLGL